MRDLALFLHLSGVLAFVSGIVVAGVASEAARRRQRADEIALLLGLARTGAALVGVGALLLLAGGLWLVGVQGDVGFGTGWIDAAIALFLLAMALGGFGGRRPRQARQLAGRLAERGEAPSGELRALLDDPASRAANYASALLVVAILALMVFQP
jgi:ABC-type transport system involved in cytochrome c biogenesis permease subunit